MLKNTRETYGSVARGLHWLTALLILALIPSGIVANAMPAGTSEELLAKAQLFSVHKTLGVVLFAVAVVRILWALAQPRPAALHPERRWEDLAARVAHWLLYGSLVLVPLTGWVSHAASEGFAPILLPIPQNLPFVPESTDVYRTAAALHIIFERVLVVTLILHIGAALKHHLWDRDATLRRMVSGRAGVVPDAGARRWSVAPVGAAVVIWLAAIGAGAGLGLFAGHDAAPQAVAAEAPVAAPATGNWVVEEGTLTITVRQLGQEVTGSFARWTADIAFDPDPAAMDPGRVAVEIDVGSLTLGQVTAQALGTDFFDAATHPVARFEAAIRRVPDGLLVAEGTLTLKGAAVPVRLTFALEITGDVARMTGETLLDRRDFAIGTQMPDEATVGFPVDVDVTLTARRVAD
ncbi:MAG: cytochrome b/b6 domain-containing protein [Rhodobacteraceae bacterium]|jgi:cytochrome b561/polyisoprenoid-binding protein YceI|nr:cytochrome b/b6 domain-containing protein [Paracoccaceae bacterium]